MIKRTLYLGNPAYVKVKNNQLVIITKSAVSEKEVTRPVEDIGVILLDHNQITITHYAIKALMKNKVALISCDDYHMPASLMLPLEGHTQQSEKYKYQIDASVPLKKKLWQQTVVAKIENQKRVLELLDKPAARLKLLLGRVQSGDPENIEAQAAAYYWPTLLDGFTRDRYGDPPNNLLNYGYAILRSMIARSLVSSGLIPTLGIHHRNKYNAYCLADDIMEPYRPFIDIICHNMFVNKEVESFLSKTSKAQLLSIATVDGQFGSNRRPLMVGMAYTTASLSACYQGEKRKINYPLLI